MLKTRVITAIIALIVMLSVFLLGNPHFMRLFFTLLVGIGTFEISTMIFPRIYSMFSANKEATPPPFLRPLVISMSCVLFAGSAYTQGYGVSVMMLGLLGSLLFGIFIAPEIDLSFGAGAGILVCLVYGAFPWLAIWELYKLAPDSRYIFLLCTIVWCGDTGAYFAGRSLGKHKLAPRMSPNKTWEGSVGGIIASVAGASVFKGFYGEQMVDWPTIIVCAVLGGALGQLGDLAESTFKRFSGVKDSGKIFPGHGGFLDRVDGLLFAAPAIWFILYQFGI
jgi:phosphatidate cytidylyltransferase